jgi:hypothetical protein
MLLLENVSSLKKKTEWIKLDIPVLCNRWAGVRGPPRGNLFPKEVKSHFFLLLTLYCKEHGRIGAFFRLFYAVSERRRRWRTCSRRGWRTRSRRGRRLWWWSLAVPSLSMPGSGDSALSPKFSRISQLIKAVCL